MAVAARLTSTLVSTDCHVGGRPRRISSVSMKMPRHVGQRQAPERRPNDFMATPSLGHVHAVPVSFAINVSLRCGCSHSLPDAPPRVASTPPDAPAHLGVPA
jgi:hypothetical protein